MLDLAEVLSAQAEERRTIEFGISADVVVRVRVQGLSILVSPFFFRLILAFNIDRARIPVRLLARNIIAAFQNENAFPRGRQAVNERSAACAGSHDDYVVLFVGVHSFSLSFETFLITWMTVTFFISI